jgi:hypothetical protein
MERLSKLGSGVITGLHRAKHGWTTLDYYLERFKGDRA